MGYDEMSSKEIAGWHVQKTTTLNVWMSCFLFLWRGLEDFRLRLTPAAHPDDPDGIWVALVSVQDMRMWSGPVIDNKRIPFRR